MSNAFRELLNVTTTVDNTYLEMQKQFGNNHSVSHTEANGNNLQVPQKDSLSFSRDKNS